jgi:hypothetical protein
MPAALLLAAGLAVSAVDADTVRLGRSRLRLTAAEYAIDAPDLDDACPGAVAIRARGTAALAAMIDGAAVIEFDFVDAGTWRPIVIMRLDGVDAAAEMQRRGFARATAEKRRLDWCESPPPPFM